MFRRRSTLQRRDRESGLVFSWRVPLSSTMSFVVAVILVGSVAAGLAALVRVRIGGRPGDDERRGTLVLMPASLGGAELSRFAREAGPFPNPWNPAADPTYAAMRGRALRDASDPAVPYHGRLVEVAPADEPASPQEVQPVFPPLPEVNLPKPPAQPRVVRLGARTIHSGKGPQLHLPSLPLEAKQAVLAAGRRFMLRYNAQGRVTEVTPLLPDPVSTGLVGWLQWSRVTGHGNESGGVVVESSIQP